MGSYHKAIFTLKLTQALLEGCFAVFIRPVGAAEPAADDVARVTIKKMRAFCTSLSLSLSKEPRHTSRGNHGNS